VHSGGSGGQAGKARGGGQSIVVLSFNTEEGERGKWAGWAKWPHGLVREKRWTRLQESLGRNRFGPPEK
jgi:hypothetical protein